MTNAEFIAKQLDKCSGDLRNLLEELDARDRQHALNMIAQGHKESTVVYIATHKPEIANITHCDPYYGPYGTKRGDWVGD